MWRSGAKLNRYPFASFFFFFELVGLLFHTYFRSNGLTGPGFGYLERKCMGPWMIRITGLRWSDSLLDHRILEFRLDLVVWSSSAVQNMPSSVDSSTNL
ncbi:hypothetical protein BD289DRAFT_265146 [Coniella lustricola]|uniref:Uncharacterized protein n=1 Tax=Coniella lustricola TaxID=2025994 RepID=A0A2T3A7E9_9PEZI|nr:hypothetical protein BD289DRAFT_265146 [Coniella lustricola]